MCILCEKLQVTKNLLHKQKIIKIFLLASFKHHVTMKVMRWREHTTKHFKKFALTETDKLEIKLLRALT